MASADTAEGTSHDHLAGMKVSAFSNTIPAGGVVASLELGGVQVQAPDIVGTSAPHCSYARVEVKLPTLPLLTKVGWGQFFLWCLTGVEQSLSKSFLS